MGRGLTPEQEGLNDYIQKFENYSRFDRYDFKNNEQVQEMLTLFIEAKEKSKTPEDTLLYVFPILDILRSMSRTINTIKYEGRTHHGYYMMKKFSIDSMPTAIELFHGGYMDSDYNPTFYIDIPPQEEEPKDKKELLQIRYRNKKLKTKNDIQEWHKYCIAVNDTKAFIYKKFPRWGKFDSQEKTDARKDLKILIEELKEFSHLTMEILILEDILKTKSFSGVFQKLKAEKLLSYELPNIDTLEKARKITKSLTEPYK